MAGILPTTTAIASDSSNSSRYSRFVVQSNDVLQEDARINVMKENSEEVIWYKERYLEEKEIVEHIIHSSTRTICWTVHRPLRGWYIRLRAPDFPPGVFIPLAPVPTRSPHYAEAALSFHSRTSLPCQSLPPDESTTYFVSPRPPTVTRSSSSSLHSYPPTPPAAPALILQPPSPTTETESGKPPVPQRRQQSPKPTITEFVLTPYADPVPNKSLFSRVMNAFRDYDKMNYYSFTLSRVAVQSPPPPYSSSPPSSPDQTIRPLSIPSSSSSSTASNAQATLSTPTSMKCLPLLTFHDRTSTFTIRSLSGLLEIDQEEEQILGIDTSFWVAVALTYLDFLSDRGSYLAVLGD
ncbi:hypothetical protein K435DRAFT_338796 [Dendrothele bispora CBS 962.96]|uniref:Uncharacterized protein n=1 Tax=Dendrothele bispora (strain CBS 962.96) TaxID=1314807 RepID=A0A4S8MIP5_DENBC|nr:hypothetical protein K435DRAFT_338796 [Dendrothele bispora CBS 962.96]